MLNVEEGDILVMVDTLAYIPDPGLEPDTGVIHDEGGLKSWTSLASSVLDGVSYSCRWLNILPEKINVN